jgi:cytochrome d ubiquinol oxidase subunit I
MREGVPTGGLPIPDLASFLTGFHADTRIVGLDTVLAGDRPPATIVHLAFDVMVGAASALALLSAWFILAWARRRDLPRTRWFLRACAPAGLLAFAALEGGWVLTEVGRQPWVVYGVLRTADAVTHAPGLWGSFAVVVAIYAAVGVSVVTVLRAMSRRWHEGKDVALPGPYAPRGPLVVPGSTLPAAADARLS